MPARAPRRSSRRACLVAILSVRRTSTPGPATCPGHPPPSRRSVAARGPSWPARLDARRNATRTDRRRSTEVRPVALFLPRIAVVVVAVLLPETWLVDDGDRQATHPLRALSRSRGAARGGAPGRRDRASAVPSYSSTIHALPPVTSSSAGSWCSRRRTRPSRTRRRARGRRAACRRKTPLHVVSSFDQLVTQWMSFTRCSRGSSRELLPAPPAALRDGPVDRERPTVEGRVWRRAERDHGESRSRGAPRPRRYPRRIRSRPTTTPETSTDRWHAPAPSLRKNRPWPWPVWRAG